MNGFFIGYGLIAIAIAITLQGTPVDSKKQVEAGIAIVALWPIVVLSIVLDDPREDH